MPLGYFRIRKIIPSHLKTQPAATHEEARRKALWLYRTCLRQSAEIQSIYPLDVPIHTIRARFRQEFEKTRFVRDLDTKNVLLCKGLSELEEMLYMWKTQSHVMKYFKDAEDEADEKRRDVGEGSGGSRWLSGFFERT